MTEDANLGYSYVPSLRSSSEGTHSTTSTGKGSNGVLVSCYILTKERENDSTNHNPRN